MFRVNHGQGRLKNQIWTGNNSNPARDVRARTNRDEETMQFKHVTLEFDGAVAVLKLDHQ